MCVLPDPRKKLVKGLDAVYYTGYSLDMNTNSTAAQSAIDNAVAVLMGVQRDRIITKAAAELNISKSQAAAVARMMGR